MYRILLTAGNFSFTFTLTRDAFSFFFSFSFFIYLLIFFRLFPILYSRFLPHKNSLLSQFGGKLDYRKIIFLNVSYYDYGEIYYHFFYIVREVVFSYLSRLTAALRITLVILKWQKIKEERN